MRGRVVPLLLVLALLTGPVIAAIWTLIIPQYQARGHVRIRPIIPRLVFKTDENGPIPFYESFVNTQVAVMRQAAVLNRVLEQSDVQRTKWYSGPKQSLMQRLTGQTDTPLERLKDGLSVQPRRRTEILDVSFTCTSAKDAVVIIEAVLQQYGSYISEMASGQRRREDLARDRLYDELKREIRDLETVISGFRKDLGTAMPQERISAMLLRLDETQNSIDELERTIVALEALVEQNGPADINDVSGTGTQKHPSYYQDAEWETLYANLRAIRHQIANNPLKPKHPDVIRLMTNLEFAEESLRLREAQLYENWRRQQSAVTGPLIAGGSGDPALTGVIMSPEQQLIRARATKQFLERKFRDDRAEHNRLFAVAQNLERTNAALRDKRALFDEVSRIIEQKQVERGGIVGAIEVSPGAFAPSRPHNDRRILYTAIALGLYSVVACGILLIRRRRAGKVGNG